MSSRTWGQNLKIIFTDWNLPMIECYQHLLKSKIFLHTALCTHENTHSNIYMPVNWPTNSSRDTKAGFKLLLQEWRKILNGWKLILESDLGPFVTATQKKFERILQHLKKVGIIFLNTFTCQKVYTLTDFIQFCFLLVNGT